MDFDHTCANCKFYEFLNEFCRHPKQEKNYKTNRQTKDTCQLYTKPDTISPENKDFPEVTLDIPVVYLTEDALAEEVIKHYLNNSLIIRVPDEDEDE